MTSSDDPKMKELFPVPGGGHVLIIPISHHPALRSLPPGEKQSTLSEVNRLVYEGLILNNFLITLYRYKSALRSFYNRYNASPIFFEVAKKMVHGVHSQMHALPIPKSISTEEVSVVTIYVPVFDIGFTRIVHCIDH